MTWTSMLAIYVLFWVLCAFLVFPFHARTHDEAGVPKVHGQADSAPAEFRALSIIGWTTFVSVLGFVAYYIVYVNDWIDPTMFDVFGN